jgi:DNA-binding FadR family transcriptional regulator
VSAETADRAVRPAKIADLVAGTLRERILSGELPDGAELPKQEELLAEFGISQPPLREALRILESERLITVRRGNVGGAVVHRPSETAAASLVGMVLQSRGATLEQLVQAMAAIEPLCVAAAAARPDRETTVLPVLRATLDESIAVIDDPEAYTGLAGRSRSAPGGRSDQSRALARKSL